MTLYNFIYLERQDDTQDGTQSVLEGVPQESLDKQILEMIRENSSVTTDKIAEKLNVSVKTVKRHIKKMESVSYVGSGYSGHWEITDNE
jgi:ATP-dependent DNA helicase RecG